MRLAKQKPGKLIQQAEENEQAEPIGWEDSLLQTLKVISPAAFERLCQGLLREAGFSKVE